MNATTTKTTTRNAVTRKTAVKRASVKRQAAKVTPAPKEVIPPAKKAEVKPVEKYTQGKTDGLKDGTVLAAIIGVVEKKSLTRDEITTAVIESGFAPPKSKAYAKDPKGYVKGYLSFAVSKKILIPA